MPPGAGLQKRLVPNLSGDAVDRGRHLGDVHLEVRSRAGAQRRVSNVAVADGGLDVAMVMRGELAAHHDGAIFAMRQFRGVVVNRGGFRVMVGRGGHERHVVACP